MMPISKRNNILLHECTRGWVHNFSFMEDLNDFLGEFTNHLSGRTSIIGEWDHGVSESASVRYHIIFPDTVRLSIANY